MTSRTVLRLNGEHEFPVPPLPVPPADAAPDPADLRRYASVSLFVERAHAVAPGFELTDANAGAVAGIAGEGGSSLRQSRVGSGLPDGPGAVSGDGKVYARNRCCYAS